MVRAADLPGAAGVAPAAMRITADGKVILESSGLRLVFDRGMRAQVFANSGGRMEPLNAPIGPETPPPQHLRIDGRSVTEFSLDAAPPAAETIETAHGPGSRIRLSGIAALPAGGSIRKSVAVEVYKRYPGTALFRTRYQNAGPQPVKVDSLVEVAWHLPRTDDLWAFHPRNLKPGEDFLFPVVPGLDLTGENIVLRPQSGADNITGGGLPAVSFMTRRWSVTIGHLLPKVPLLRFPV
ncbi:MAG: hypothetical protein ACREF9_15465, partial [Opitutaceae bacterium]